ncbi:hypothetical protein OPS25_06895 [Alteromonas ponticola]|uniref:Uncharacterized protein n=1 Tax=Alteromonas aquimaris TaxID=2998417 RepID=A0ABT3P616_9ALTE|nr:hypothetical protein [Alteromonas aquimaris]MCW8108218.1 hypothetical protein [Alteromonas aquimaris]
MNIQIVLIIIAILLVPTFVLAKNNDQNGIPSQMEEIIRQQELINEKLDQLLASDSGSCTLEQFINNEECDDVPVVTTVSYCIDQGNEIGAEMAYGLALKTELSAGAGWDIGPTIGLQIGAEMPTVPAFPIILPAPLSMPVGVIFGPPLPTEGSITGGANMSRGHSTCLEIPITLSVELLNELRELSADANDAFQRRISNLLQYARNVVDRRENLQCVEDSFDGILREAIQSESDNRVGFLKDEYISSLLQCSDLPKSLANIFENPDDLFNKIPEVQTSDLADYQLWLNVMNELDNLNVNRVNSLPSAQSIKNVICAALPSTQVGVRRWRSEYCD